MGDRDGELFGYDLVYLLGCCDFFLCRDVLQELGNDETREMIEDWGWEVMVVRRVDGSMPSPTSNQPEERMKIPPVRINHKKGHIPDPTHELFEELALKGWLDYSAQMSEIVDHDMPEWDDLSSELKEVWVNIARGQFTVMSLIGEAKIETIEDADKN